MVSPEPRIDPLGNRVSYTYDVDSRLIRTTNPIGAITTQIFDANSRLIATIDPLGLRNSYAYDASSNLIRTVNPLGQINTTVFDLANRVKAQIDPIGNRTSFAYDGAWTRSAFRTRLASSQYPFGGAIPPPARQHRPWSHGRRTPGPLALDAITHASTSCARRVQLTGAGRAWACRSVRSQQRRRQP